MEIKEAPQGMDPASPGDAFRESFFLDSLAKFVKFRLRNEKVGFDEDRTPKTCDLGSSYPKDCDQKGKDPATCNSLLKMLGISKKSGQNICPIDCPIGLLFSDSLSFCRSIRFFQDAHLRFIRTVLTETLCICPRTYFEIKS